MKKILFLIHDLGHGGAEKVLINMVNNLDKQKYDITVISLFGGGVNGQFLDPSVHHWSVIPFNFRGNSKVMKVFSPDFLHDHIVKQSFDVEVAYLEGPCARIISGCRNPHTKTVGWIHIEQLTKERASQSFRDYEEALQAYKKLDHIVCVAKTVKEDFFHLFPMQTNSHVLYNVNESEQIRQWAADPVPGHLFVKDEINLTAIGKLITNKGFYRLIPIVSELRKKGYPVHLYILGTGPQKDHLEQLIQKEGIGEYVTFLGYQLNPYKYLSKSDLFVCASHSEGFSTAATEAIILGIPVCTVEVSGMKEILGEHNEWGVVTDNQDEALLKGIESMIRTPQILLEYKKKARSRSSFFEKSTSLKRIEEFLDSI